MREAPQHTYAANEKTVKKPDFLSLLPAATVINGHIVRPSHSTDELLAFLSHELTTPKLDRVHEHLWLAGLTRPARPLHRQILLRREITVTEDPNEHLVWKENQIFIKPLPEYLLQDDFWHHAAFRNHKGKPLAESHPHQTGDITDQVHRSACGLLLSYTWLVTHPSDLRVAHSAGLLPQTMTWTEWDAIKGDLLGRLTHNSRCRHSGHMHVSRRYLFGELRLTRLNLLYAVLPHVATTRSFIYGYMSTSTWYQDYFRTHFAWIFLLFAYFTVILAAMQVGLSTVQLQGSATFQRVCVAVVVSAVVLIALTMLVVILSWTCLFAYSVLSTRKFVNQTLKPGKICEHEGRLECACDGGCCDGFSASGV
ncbi:Hypothetical protein D9617_20g028240 [Elsinoe fawcettii]|nr:Hypothetical protein D9617_20g028240 [Elsinoe fawcettii]